MNFRNLFQPRSLNFSICLFLKNFESLLAKKESKRFRVGFYAKPTEPINNWKAKLDEAERFRGI